MSSDMGESRCTAKSRLPPFHPLSTGVDLGKQLRYILYRYGVAGGN